MTPFILRMRENVEIIIQYCAAKVKNFMRIYLIFDLGYGKSVLYMLKSYKYLDGGRYGYKK